jgi:uncharacterized protein YggT (Ycf19 family)
MRFILLLFIEFLIVGLFLYSKLLPYKDRLVGGYRKVFNFWGTIFEPILKFFRGFIKPVKVGNGLAVDMSQIVLLFIFLIILTAL